MKIVWDEPNRLANIDKHGLDFADLTVEFFAASMIVPARDNRYIAIGALNDGSIAVVFVRLGSEGISVISMRLASAKERKLL